MLKIPTLLIPVLGVKVRTLRVRYCVDPYAVVGGQSTSILLSEGAFKAQHRHFWPKPSEALKDIALSGEDVPDARSPTDTRFLVDTADAMCSAVCSF